MLDLAFNHPRTRAALVLLAGAVAACSANSSQPVGQGGSSTTGSTASSTTTSSTGDDCTMLCATEIQACPMVKTMGCVAECEAAKTAVTWCTAEATAATDCLAMEPASSFGCDMNGAPMPNTGVCTSEISAEQSCWYKGPPGGLPDMTQACANFCKYESFLSCHDPNCTADCAAVLQAPDAAPVCNGALAAVIACASTKPPSDFQCSTGTPPLPELKPGICPFQVALLAACTAGK